MDCPTCPTCPISVWYELFVTIRILGLLAAFTYLARLFLDYLFKI